jgi:hypothetical protein
MGFYRRGREERREWRHRTKMYHDELLYIMIPYSLGVLAILLFAPEDWEGTWGRIFWASTFGLIVLGGATVLMDAWHEARYSSYETVCRRDYQLDMTFIEGRIERKLARRELTHEKTYYGKGKPHSVDIDPEDIEGVKWLLKVRRRRPSGGVPCTRIVLMTSVKDLEKVEGMEDLVDEIILGRPDIHDGPPGVKEPPKLVVYDD